MGLQITLNTAGPLSKTEVAILQLLVDAYSAPVTPPAPPVTAEAPAPAKKAAAKKIAAKKAAPAPEPSPEAEEDPTEGEDEDINELAAEALTIAQTMLKSGRAAEVREALSEIGVGKVSEIKEAAKIRKFMELVS